jgi:hypothetical protein
MVWRWVETSTPRVQGVVRNAHPLHGTRVNLACSRDGCLARALLKRRSIMSMLRISIFLLTLLGASLPTTGQAQSAPPTLQIAQLTCPECACVRARDDARVLRQAYREAHQKVSTRSARTTMTAGLAGAGGVAVATLVASVFVPLIQVTTDYGHEHPGSQAHAERTSNRILAAGGVLLVVPLTIGLVGAAKLGERRREVAPYVERDAALRTAYTQSVRAQREQCRGIR